MFWHFPLFGDATRVTPLFVDVHAHTSPRFLAWIHRVSVMMNHNVAIHINVCRCNVRKPGISQTDKAALSVQSNRGGRDHMSWRHLCHTSHMIASCIISIGPRCCCQTLGDTCVTKCPAAACGLFPLNKQQAKQYVTLPANHLGHCEVSIFSLEHLHEKKMPGSCDTRSMEGQAGVTSEVRVLSSIYDLINFSLETGTLAFFVCWWLSLHCLQQWTETEWCELQLFLSGQNRDPNPQFKTDSSSLSHPPTPPKPNKVLCHRGRLF